MRILGLLLFVLIASFNSPAQARTTFHEEERNMERVNEIFNLFLPIVQRGGTPNREYIRGAAASFEAAFPGAQIKISKEIQVCVGTVCRSAPIEEMRTLKEIR